MEHKGSILRWRLSLAECLTMAAVVISMTLWITSNFQSKADATKQDIRIAAMESNMNQIAVDVSYIRGRLEPKK